MSYSHFKTSIVAFSVSLIVPVAAFAAGSGITYHGRLIDPNGVPVVSSDVQFKMQIRTPGNESCLMYEEVQAKDLSQTSGVFSVTINDGSGTRMDASGYGLDQVFANRQSYSFSPATCTSGSSYAPNATDGRRIQVFFNDGTLPTGQWEPIPAQPVNFIPMAIESQQVGGYKKEQLIKVADGVSTTQTELNTASWTELLALIAGTSAKFVKPTDQVTQLHGAAVPAPSNGQSIRWNSALNAGAGSWENFTPGSAVSVTSVTAGTGLNVGAGPGGSITTTGTLNINVGTGANQIVQLDGTSKLPAVDASNLTNIATTGLANSAVTFAKMQNIATSRVLGRSTAAAGAIEELTLGAGLSLTAGVLNVSDTTDNDVVGGLSCAGGDVAKYNGSAWVCQGTASANTVSTLIARDVSGNFTAGSGTYTTSIKVTDGAAGGQVTISAPAAFTSYGLVLPTTDGGSNEVLTTNGSGVLSWTTPGTGLPAASGTAAAPGYAFSGNTNTGMFAAATNEIGFTTNGGERVRIDPTGKVGIGTTVPAAKLDVAGAVKVGTSVAVCDSTTKGSIRYNTTTNVLEFCNATGWNLVQAAACSDATPTVVSFANEANATLSTLYTSNILQITGMNCAVATSISGSGSPQYRTCSDAACTVVIQDWTTGPSSINSGEYAQIRQTSDAAGGVTNVATFITGSAGHVWNVTTTGSCASSPAIGTVCADGTVYAGLSPDGGVPMYAQRCDLGLTWDGTNCTGAAWTLTWNNGSTTYTTTGYTNVNTGEANTTGLAASVDGGSPYNAAQACDSLNQHGQTDWYLPAQSELNILITNKGAIRNFDTSGVYYWSSCEYGSDSARAQYASSGYQNNTYKYGAYRVRCVRR